MVTGNFLNFFECTFDNDTIEIMKTEYTNEEEFVQLRDTYKNLFFYRFEGNDVFFWNKTKDYIEPDFDFVKVHISLKDYSQIFRVILSNSISQMFYEKGAKTKKMKYSSTIEINSKKNLAKDIIDGLEINTVMLLDTYYSNEFNILGFTLSTRVNHSFLWSKQEFVNRGIDIRDLKYNEEYIYPNKKSIERFLYSTNNSEKYNQLIYKAQDKKNTYNTIISTCEYIKKNINNIFLHKDMRINSIDIKCLPYSSQVFSTEILNSPQHYYYLEKSISKLKYDEAITRLKPYTYELFNSKKINIAILCPKKYEGIVENFIVKLDDRLKKIFHLDIDFTTFYIDKLDIEGYKGSLYKNIFNENTNYNMSLIILEEIHKKYTIDKSPYHFCKAKLIGRGVTSQEILIEKIKGINDYILNNIALNIYAKLGGTPWTIEKIEKQKQELIIGISSCLDKAKNKIFGISQVFDYNGTYLLTDCSPLTSMDNYEEMFEKYLKNILDNVITSQIDISKEFRLIFHLNKTPSKRYEIKAIENVLKQYSNIKFSYALVHLNYTHNFRIYNNKGIYDNTRGQYINLDSNKTLLSLVSKSTNPLLIDIDKRSSFIDKDYITKQIYWFCHLSYRSFIIPAKKTVTMQYPYLVTKLTNELKIIDGWDYEILEKIGDKLWFI